MWNFDFGPTGTDAGTQYGLRMQMLDNGIDAVGSMQGMINVHNLDTDDPLSRAFRVQSSAGTVGIAFDADDDDIDTALSQRSKEVFEGS